MIIITILCVIEWQNNHVVCLHYQQYTINHLCCVHVVIIMKILARNPTPNNCCFFFFPFLLLASQHHYFLLQLSCKWWEHAGVSCWWCKFFTTQKVLHFFLMIIKLCTSDFIGTMRGCVTIFSKVPPHIQELTQPLQDVLCKKDDADSFFVSCYLWNASELGQDEFAHFLLTY